MQRGPSAIEVTFDEKSNPVLHSPGDANIIVPGHRDIDFRQHVLLVAPFDEKAMTFTAPGTLVEAPDRAAFLATMVNDALAQIVSDRGDRFAALATLPLNDPAASVAEFERA